MHVEPTPELMLRPSGSAPITMTCAPARRSKSGANREAAPCAQSTTTRSPASGAAALPWRSRTVPRRYSRYRSLASVASVTRPKPAAGAPTGPWFPEGARRSSASRSSISDSTASGSLTPPLAKILIPLSGAGLWLADSTTPNTAPVAAVRCATAGVGMTPRRTASTPLAARPATTAASRNSPDARGSRPTTAKGRSRCCRSGASAAAAAGARTQAAAAATSMASPAVSSRPAAPLMPSVPNSWPITRQYPPRRGDRWRSALGVLGSLAGLLQAGLLALGDTRVPGQEARPLQRRPAFRVDQRQRPGDAEPQGACLAADTAAVDAGDDIKLVLSTERHQRLTNQLLVHLVREIHVEGPVVDLPLAGAGLDPHPGDGLL